MNTDRIVKLSEDYIAELKIVVELVNEIDSRNKVLDGRESQIRETENRINIDKRILEKRLKEVDEREEYLLTMANKQRIEAGRLEEMAKQSYALKSEAEEETKRLKVLKKDAEELLLRKDELLNKEKDLTALENLLLKEKAIDRERKEILNIKEKRVKDSEERLQMLSKV